MTDRLYSMRPQDVLLPLAGAAIGYTAMSLCLYGPSSLSDVPRKAWSWLQRRVPSQVSHPADPAFPIQVMHLGL